MVGLSPEEKARLMGNFLGESAIESRDKDSQAEHKRLSQLTPAERKLDRSLRRAEALPHSGEVVSDIEIKEDKTRRKRISSRIMGAKRTARGQVRLHGSTEEVKE